MATGKARRRAGGTRDRDRGAVPGRESSDSREDSSPPTEYVPKEDPTIGNKC